MKILKNLNKARLCVLKKLNKFKTNKKKNKLYIKNSFKQIYIKIVITLEKTTHIKKKLLNKKINKYVKNLKY